MADEPSAALGPFDIRRVMAALPHRFPMLLVEALAQAAGVLAVETLGLAGSGKLVYFMAIDGVKFRTPVEPGVLLTLEVEFVQRRATVCKFAGRALIAGKLAAECSFTAMIADPPKD